MSTWTCPNCGTVLADQQAMKRSAAFPAASHDDAHHKHHGQVEYERDGCPQLCVPLLALTPELREARDG